MAIALGLPGRLATMFVVGFLLRFSSSSAACTADGNGSGLCHLEAEVEVLLQRQGRIDGPLTAIVTGIFGGDAEQGEQKADQAFPEEAVANDLGEGTRMTNLQSMSDQVAQAAASTQLEAATSVVKPVPRNDSQAALVGRNTAVENGNVTIEDRVALALKSFQHQEVQAVQSVVGCMTKLGKEAAGLMAKEHDMLDAINRTAMMRSDVKSAYNKFVDVRHSNGKLCNSTLSMMEDLNQKLGALARVKSSLARQTLVLDDATKATNFTKVWAGVAKPTTAVLVQAHRHLSDYHNVHRDFCTRALIGDPHSTTPSTGEIEAQRMGLVDKDVHQDPTAPALAGEHSLSTPNVGEVGAFCDIMIADCDARVKNGQHALHMLKGELEIQANLTGRIQHVYLAQLNMTNRTETAIAALSTTFRRYWLQAMKFQEDGQFQADLSQVMSVPRSRVHNKLMLSSIDTPYHGMETGASAIPSAGGAARKLGAIAPGAQALLAVTAESATVTTGNGAGDDQRGLHQNVVTYKALLDILVRKLESHEKEVMNLRNTHVLDQMALKEAAGNLEKQRNASHAVEKFLSDIRTDFGVLTSFIVEALEISGNVTSTEELGAAHTQAAEHSVRAVSEALAWINAASPELVCRADDLGDGLSLLEEVVESSANSTAEPSANSTAEPTANSTAEPSANSTVEPTANSTAEPMANSTAEPTANSTAEPTANSTAEPTANSTAEPTAEPTANSTTEASANSTAEPEADPEVEPADDPLADDPFAEPVADPSTEPTVEPSVTSEEAIKEWKAKVASFPDSDLNLQAMHEKFVSLSDQGEALVMQILQDSKALGSQVAEDNNATVTLRQRNLALRKVIDVQRIALGSLVDFFRDVTKLMNPTDEL